MRVKRYWGVCIIAVLSFSLTASIHNTNLDRLRKTGIVVGASTFVMGVVSFKHPKKTLLLAALGSVMTTASLFGDMAFEVVLVTTRALYTLRQRRCHKMQQRHREAEIKNVEPKEVPKDTKNKSRSGIFSYIKHKYKKAKHKCEEVVHKVDQRIDNKVLKVVEQTTDAIAAGSILADEHIKHKRSQEEVAHGVVDLREAYESLKRISLLRALNKGTNGLYHYVRGCVRNRLWIASQNIINKLRDRHKQKMALKKQSRKRSSSSR